VSVREAFDAAVDVRGPDPRERGYFLVRRRTDVDHERFRGLVSTHVGGDGAVVLDSPGGIVVVLAPYSVARGLLRLPETDHVGGVQIDAERLRQVLTPAGDALDRGSTEATL
jgi:hypothetical protein